MASDIRPFGQLFAQEPRNGLTRPKAVRGSGVKMVNMGELFAYPRLRNAPMDRVPFTQAEAARFLLLDGDLLFARQSLVLEGAGKCSLFLSDDEPVTFESHITRVRLDAGEADPAFYFYYLQSPHGREAIRSIVEQGAGASGIRGSDLKTLNVLWLPLPAQRVLAGILGALDDKIEQNRRTARTLERLARSIFRAWFVDFEPVKAKATGATSFPSMPRPVFDALPTRFVDSDIGLIPEGWEVKALSTAFEVNPKRSLPRGASAPYLDMKNMPTEGHAPDGCVNREVGSGMKFMNGDTLVARITPCLENGKTAFVDFLPNGQVGWGSTEYIVFRPRSPLPNVFAYCLARAEAFRDFAVQNMSGTSGRQRVAATAMDHYRIAVPSEDVATAFGQTVDPMFRIARAGVDESRKLAEIRDYLLPKLLSGNVLASGTAKSSAVGA